jgi:hypothetical protein
MSGVGQTGTIDARAGLRRSTEGRGPALDVPHGLTDSPNQIEQGAQRPTLAGDRGSTNSAISPLPFAALRS